jgi:hypothetical protein
MTRLLLLTITSGTIVALGCYLLLETFSLLYLDLNGHVSMKIVTFVLLLAATSIGSAIVSLLLRGALLREERRGT